MKKGDGGGGACGVILGEDEIAKATAAVKALRASDADKQQASVPFDAVVDYLVDQIVGHDHDHDHVHYHH